MKDRLKELIKDTLKEWECDVTDKTIEEIADHLITNDVIAPPCKVGETMYRIVKRYNGEKIIVEGYAFEFAITHESSQNDKYRFYFWAKPDKSHTSREYSIWCEFEDFGKTVFLTQAAAEQKLKEIK